MKRKKEKGRQRREKGARGGERRGGEKRCGKSRKAALPVHTISKVSNIKTFKALTSLNLKSNLTCCLSCLRSSTLVVPDRTHPLTGLNTVS